jgi:hypothetical protein
MNKLFKMKLHESITPNINNADVLIIRVPGGWIYKMSEHEQKISGGGFENFRSTAVFIPLHPDCNEGDI